MKQTIKRLSALLLAMAMALCLLSANVWAAEEAEEDVSVPSAGEAFDGDAGNEARVEPQKVVETGECGESSEYELRDDGLLIIRWSGKGHGMQPLTKHFSGDERIKRLDISSGISAIPYSTFFGCTNLREANICLVGTGGAGSATQIKSIGASAFYGCTSLTHISLPTVLETLEDRAFEGCTKLHTVRFNNKLKSIGEDVFKDCTTLDNVTLPASLENLGKGAFSGCTGMGNLTIPEGKLRGIRAEDETAAQMKGQELQGMHSGVFANCTKLSNILLTGALEVIPSGTFSGCTNLRYMRINSGIKEICISAFEDCTKLETVEFPNTLKVIGVSAFLNCPRLKAVSIPDSVSTIDIWALGFKDNLTDTKVDRFTINGNSGTEAESYADANGFKFVDLSKVPRSGFTRVENKKKGLISCYWTKQVGGSGYELQCSTDKRFKKNVTRMSISHNTIVNRGFSGLKKGIYYVRIRTIGKTAGRYSEWSGAIKVKVTKGYDLSMPVLTSVKPGKKGEFKAKWKRNTDGKGYQLQYCTVKTFKKNVKTVSFFRNSAVNFTAKKLKKGWYYVRVRTIKGKKTSAWCKTKSVLVS